MPPEYGESMLKQTTADMKSKPWHDDSCARRRERSGGGALHGYGETGDMGAPLAAVLVRDHTVLVPDLRGLGPSSRPAGGHDRKTQAGDVAGVLDALKIAKADLDDQQAPGEPAGYLRQDREPGERDSLSDTAAGAAGRHHSATSTVWPGDQTSVTVSPGAAPAASWFWVRSLISAPLESSRMKVETAPA